jgi:SAM-dependent methyltransferase
VRGGRLRNLIRGARRWPIHPQWLLSTKDEANQLAKTLALFNGTILDIGCADGHLSKVLPTTCHYVGLDYPSTAMGMYGTRPDVFADAAHLPFGDASIDGVILKDVLEHVRNPEIAMAEIARVIRPAGRLMLWMPFMYPIHDAPHDYQRFTEHGLRAYLAGHGFEVENLKPVLHNIEAAALLTCLALADAGEQILARKQILLFPMLPILGCLVLITNLVARGLAWLPGTRFMPAFYRLVAIRAAS